MANIYDQDDPIKIYTSSTFQTAAGTAFDPDEVYVEVKGPSGTTTTYQYGVDAELTKNGTGDYQLVLDDAQKADGVWHYYIYGRMTAGTIRGGSKSYFTVNGKGT